MYLDLLICFTKDHLTTPHTDTFSVCTLHFTSAHPDHSKSFIIFSQTLSIKRIRSRKKDFEKNLDNIKSWLHKKVILNI